MFLWMLIACPAERLGVEVPKGGVGKISQEDLQRDVYALTRPGADVAEVFARRMGQMHLAPSKTGDGFSCSEREGTGSPFVVAAPWPGSVGDAAQVAVLVSLAKGWDGMGPPRHSVWLCVARDGATLPEGERVQLPAVEADRIEAIDYRALRTRTQALFTELNR